jgi:hypothetical protein
VHVQPEARDLPPGGRLAHASENLVRPLAGQQQHAEDDGGDGRLSLPDSPEGADFILGKHTFARPLLSGLAEAGDRIELDNLPLDAEREDLGSERADAVRHDGDATAGDGIEDACDVPPADRSRPGGHGAPHVSVRPTAHPPFTTAVEGGAASARFGFGRPGRRRELVESVVGLAREALEECAQVGVGLERVAFGAGDEAVELGGPDTAGVAPGEEPVLAAESHPTEGTLRRGVVGYELAVAEVALESRPLAAGVADRRGQCALG